jgi:NADPH:quinone reductase-like Zn-dependent oxidoreductase
VQDFAKEVANFTDKKGANIILDFIGAPYFEQNINSLATDGTLMMISVMGGFKLDELNLYPFLKKRITVKGTTLRARDIVYKQKLIVSFLKSFSSELSTGTIRPVIDCVFDWNNVIEAHKYMEANRNKGKILLKVTGV